MTSARKDRRLRIVPGALAAAIALVAAALTAQTASPRGQSASGLPQTGDYHSLLVAPDDPARLILGTHEGLFTSTDGGRTWRHAGLSGQDAMTLARPSRKTIWAAGHDVLAKSTDGGASWTDVRPDGLPGLDLHGFATDPARPGRLYAAVAGEGLYRSRNNGRSFSLVSKEVGGAVFALAVTRDGRIFAGDLKRGLLVSRDGGRSWRESLRAQLLGIAVNPRESNRLIAAGPGIFLSENGGRTWRRVFELSRGAGPVAWSPSSPSVAYAVGFARKLYRSSDGGRSWRAVR